MGSERLRELTGLGDVVNTAARVESLTRQHGVDILITAAVRDQLEDAFDLRELPATAVKGKRAPINTWAVSKSVPWTPADQIASPRTSTFTRWKSQGAIPSRAPEN